MLRESCLVLLQQTSCVTPEVSLVLIKSTVSAIVLVFLKIMAMERSRCRGGGADYKLHKTSSSIGIGSGAGFRTIVRNIVRESQGEVREFHFFFKFSGNPVDEEESCHKCYKRTHIARPKLFD